jgi:hypothetical protein
MVSNSVYRGKRYRIIHHSTYHTCRATLLQLSWVGCRVGLAPCSAFGLYGRNRYEFMYCTCIVFTLVSMSRTTVHTCLRLRVSKLSHPPQVHFGRIFQNTTMAPPFPYDFDHRRPNIYENTYSATSNILSGTGT